MTEEIEKRWSQLTARMDNRDPALLDDLEAIQADLQVELFGGRPELGQVCDPEPQSLSILLDALEALELLEPDDASYPWDRALILNVVGRPLDAAHAYVEAANRFSRAPAVTGDESTGLRRLETRRLRASTRRAGLHRQPRSRLWCPSNLGACPSTSASARFRASGTSNSARTATSSPRRSWASRGSRGTSRSSTTSSRRAASRSSAGSCRSSATSGCPSSTTTST